MVYAELVALLNFTVDLLLLVGSNRLAGHPPAWRRAFLAAGIGGTYAYFCLMPGFGFFSATLWRIVVLLLMAAIAYGMDAGAVRRGALFLLLSMALGGIASGMHSRNFLSLTLCAALVYILCAFGLWGRAGRKFARVEIIHNGKRVNLTALLDTGNCLTDPITGAQVIVAGCDMGRELFDLNESQLSNPVEIAQTQPGRFRLIPYRAVGQAGSMLLCFRPQQLRINGKICDALVAFSPQNFGKNGQFQALAGGNL